MVRNLRKVAAVVSGCCSIAALTACSQLGTGGFTDAAAEPSVVTTPGAVTVPDGAASSGNSTITPDGAVPNGAVPTTAPGTADLLTTGAGTARSVRSAESSLMITGDDGSKSPYAHFQQPDLVQLLPQGLPQVTPNDALGLIATPTGAITPAYANAGDTKVVLALNSNTDRLLNMPAHWAVVGQQDGWVEVMTPVGRGSVPSKDPSQVNHHAVWVKASDVTITQAQYRIEVSTEDYTMTVTGPKGSNTFHIGVGKVGKTETPKGLCAIVGKIVIQTGEPGLLTNCQSEMLDNFDGASDAATAIHEYHELGFDPAVGGAVSNGCMRIPNDAFEKYLSDIPAGTPLIIK